MGSRDDRKRKIGSWKSRQLFRDILKEKEGEKRKGVKGEMKSRKDFFLKAGGMCSFL